MYGATLKMICFFIDYCQFHWLYAGIFANGYNLQFECDLLTKIVFTARKKIIIMQCDMLLKLWKSWKYANLYETKFPFWTLSVVVQIFSLSAKLLVHSDSMAYLGLYLGRGAYVFM